MWPRHEHYTKLINASIYFTRHRTICYVVYDAHKEMTTLWSGGGGLDDDDDNVDDDDADADVDASLRLFNVPTPFHNLAYGRGVSVCVMPFSDYISFVFIAVMKGLINFNT